MSDVKLTLNETQVALLASAATMYSDQLAEMAEDNKLRTEESDVAEWAERAGHDIERLAQLLTWHAHLNRLQHAIENDATPARQQVITKHVIGAAMAYDSLTVEGAA